MKFRIIILFLSLFVITPVLAQKSNNNCMNCHQGFEDEKNGPAHKFVRDIHFQKGLSCHDCHGGNPDFTDMEKVRASENFQGVPDHLKVPEFCARCHSDSAYMHEHNPSLPTDQLDKYKTSIHGQKLFSQNDKKVANCVSCHGVHDIGNAKMPHSSTHPLNIPETCGKCHADKNYMAPYNISTTQLDDYKKSVHGQALLEKKDLGAPACNSCHGNHGAAPPGVASLSAVCGNCHALEAELFNTSPHREAFEKNKFPMCETCHSNHLIIKPHDQLVGTSEPALCINCHSSEDGTKGLQTAKTISENLKSLFQEISKATLALEQAKEKGMMTTDEEFLLKEVNQALIQTRTQVHSFNAGTVVKKAKEGIDKAKKVKTESENLIDEYFFRRKGLGIATLFITILIVALYFKIRQVEKK